MEGVYVFLTIMLAIGCLGLIVCIAIYLYCYTSNCNKMVANARKQNRRQRQKEVQAVKSFYEGK